MVREPLAPSTSVILPAFNEQGAIARVVRELREAGEWREVLVVDDGSEDQTAREAEGAGALVIRHPYRKGNGAAIKTGLRRATGDFILLLDADGQHRPADAPRLVKGLSSYDLVVGARSPHSQSTLARQVGNALLNWLASYLGGVPIPDLTSGFRAARRAPLLEFIHLLPNGFSTPTTTTLAFLRAGYSIRFEAIDAERRDGTSKIHLGTDGFRFFLILLKVITIFSPLRVFLPVSATAFVVGAAYALWTVMTQAHVTNSSVLLIVVSVLIFLIGLVSEQIAALRFEGRRP